MSSFGPSVSVVTTCFNEAEYVVDAIRSVAAQTHPVLEHVVVDDGSSDPAVATTLAAWPHLKVVRVTNRGMPNARNAGIIALDPCDFVVFLDADDWLEPNFVEATLDAACFSGADVVCPGLVRHDRHGIHEVAFPDVINPTVDELWNECHGYSCVLVRRDLLSEIGGFHGLTSGDCDWDFWIDVTARDAQIVYAPTHYHYRVHRDSWTRKFSKSERAANVAEMRRHHRR